MFSLRTGLEFLDFPIIIPSQTQFLTSLLADEENHAYVLNSFKFCISEYDYDERSVNNIGVNLIKNARTIQNVFTYFMEICTFAITDTIIKAFKLKVDQFTN